MMTFVEHHEPHKKSRKATDPDYTAQPSCVHSLPLCPMPGEDTVHVAIGSRACVWLNPCVDALEI